MDRLTADEIIAKANRLKDSVGNGNGGIVEIVGNWIWITFASKPSNSVIQTIKQEDGRWNRNRKIWQINNGYWGGM